jgi:hypothetical protein
MKSAKIRGQSLPSESGLLGALVQCDDCLAIRGLQFGVRAVY